MNSAKTISRLFNRFVVCNLSFLCLCHINIVLLWVQNCFSLIQIILIRFKLRPPVDPCPQKSNTKGQRFSEKDWYYLKAQTNRFAISLSYTCRLNELDYGVSSFWLVLWDKGLSLFRGQTMNFHQTRPKVIEGCLKDFFCFSSKLRSYIWLHPRWIHSHWNFLQKY